MDLTKEITIKDSGYLKVLSVLSGTKKSILIDRVINHLIDILAIQDMDDCGYTIKQLFGKEFDLRTEMVAIMPRISPYIQRLATSHFSRLIVWGVNDDCPECGCEIKCSEHEFHGVHWSDNDCTVCEFSTSAHPDYDIVTN